ncbi:MAG: VOC family protein [Bacteroidota bacterium]
MNPNLTATDIKVFVPAKDYQQSMRFYQALGWKLLADHGKVAVMELGGVRFFLQDYYQKAWAHNFMLYINVEDVQAWYEHAKSVIENGAFGEAKIKAPEQQAHGDIVCYVWDPGGALLHFAQAV